MRRGAILMAALALGGCGGAAERNQSANDVAATLGGITIQPGLWVITSEVTEVSAPNLPLQARDRMLGARPPIRSCITPEQAARPDARFLAAEGGNGCSYADFAMANGRMTGTMRCPEAAGATTAQMTGDYRPDRYVLTMTIETPMPDGAVMRVNTRTVGRRTGDCPNVPTQGDAP